MCLTNVHAGCICDKQSYRDNRIIKDVIMIISQPLKKIPQRYPIICILSTIKFFLTDARL